MKSRVPYTRVLFDTPQQHDYCVRSTYVRVRTVPRTPTHTLPVRNGLNPKVEHMLSLRNNSQKRPGKALDSEEVVAALHLALRENAVAAAAFIFLVAVTTCLCSKISGPLIYVCSFAEPSCLVSDCSEQDTPDQTCLH